MKSWHTFLEENPWDREWSRLHPPVEYFFQFNFPIKLDRLWSILADTSRLNQALGLPEMTFHEKEGKKIGSYKILGIPHEWYEIPWQWIYGEFISAERVFSKGLLYYARARFEISVLEDGSKDIIIYFGWIPRNWKGKMVFSFSRNSFRKKLIRTLESLEESIESNNRENDKLPLHIETNRKQDLRQLLISPEIREKISTLQEKAKTLDYIDVDLLQKFLYFIFFSGDEKVARLRPKLVARELNGNLHKFLSLMLYLTHEGVLNLSWDILCPNCQSIKGYHSHLGESPENAQCDKCNINFREEGYNMLEISFSIHPSLRKTESRLFCSAEPAQKPKILVQKKVAPQSIFVFKPRLHPGRYRLLRMDKLGYNYLDIEEDALDRSLSWSSEDSDKVFRISNLAKIHLMNESHKECIFVIQSNDIDQDVLRPYELFNNQQFRELFPDEKIAEGLSIDIGIQNIVFIDMAGSSKIFQELGDTKAFSLVRAFYSRAREIAQKYEGSVVKTIGDAVMLAFSNPLSGLRAAMQMQSYIDEHQPGYLARISLNRGSCLAVNLDSSIDYFGNAVNVAAKMQEFTEAQEISVSRDYSLDEKVAKYMRSKKINMSKAKSSYIEGVGEFEYFKFQVKSKKSSVSKESSV